MNAQAPQGSFQIAGASPDIAARLRRRTRHALLLVGVLVFGFFGLAAAAQVAGAVIGMGEITVDSSIKTISHADGGVLVALLVRDGDHVTEGQELMRFDTSVSRVGSSSASLGLEALIATQARLQAERDGADTIAFPPDIAASREPAVIDLLARERRLFALRRDERRGTLALLTERVHQYEDQIASLTAQIDAIDRQAKLIEPELAGLRVLYERQLVPLARINALERSAVQLQGSKAALQANIAETRARISETREQMLNIEKASRSEAGTQLAAVGAQLNDQRLRQASAAATHGRGVIRAPQSGTIDKLAFSTIGSAVPPNQPILQIVPDSDTLIVAARISPNDVDQLRLGQAARVTFSGLDRQTTPDISGTLIFISPDLAEDQRTGASFYRIKIRLDARQLAQSRQISLKPGMPAEVYIETGNRSILSFLIKPLLDQIRRSFREG